MCSCSGATQSNVQHLQTTANTQGGKFRFMDNVPNQGKLALIPLIIKAGQMPVGMVAIIRLRADIGPTNDNNALNYRQPSLPV